MSSHQHLNKVVLQSVSAGDCEHCSTSFWESAVAPGRLRHSCASLSWTATPNWLSSKPTAATPFQFRLSFESLAFALSLRPSTRLQAKNNKTKCTRCKCHHFIMLCLLCPQQVHCRETASVFSDVKNTSLICLHDIIWSRHVYRNLVSHQGHWIPKLLTEVRSKGSP